jgi:hypothetical protein
MSLTRTEWIRMWHEIKEIERNAKLIDTSSRPITKVRRNSILASTTEIKRLIQSVIGQMEP